MTRAILVALLLFLASRLALASEIPDITATVCFTLRGESCAALAVAEINKAQKTLQVQAYNFTEQNIIGAIVKAKARGVAVTVLIDKISPSQQCEGADPVRNAGIPTFVDHKPKIAHNKVMVIDGATTLTGSFNWSSSAEHSNAENLVVLRSPGIAALYAENFQRRLSESTPYDGTHGKPVKACNVGVVDD